MKQGIKVFSLCLVLILSACGFRPLYESSGSIDSRINFASIREVSYLEKLPSKFDFEFRRKLNELFAQDSASQYWLDVNVTKVSSSFDIQNTSVTTRKAITIAAEFKMIDKSNLAIVLADKVLVMDSFDVGGSPYSNYLSDEQTSIKLSEALANEIVIRVLTHIGGGCAQ